MNFKVWFELHEYGVILIATGAYNPIHRGHIKVFYHAKRFLQTKNMQVVKAYVIPRNYEYIQKKSAAKKETPVDDYHRQQLIQLAIQGTFIQILPLEKIQNHLSREEIRNVVQKMHPYNQIIFVAGDDKGECPNDPQSNICLEDLPKFGQTVIVGRKLAGDASSTTVRNNLQQYGDEPKLLSPKVRNYIRQNQLWGAKHD